MGKWVGYHLTVDPGDRAVEHVAGELRASLATVDVPGIHRPARRVRTKDGQVHWGTGRSHRATGYFHEYIIPELRLPCARALGIWQSEAEWYGNGELYEWTGEELTLIEEFEGAYGAAAADAVLYFEHKYGISGETVK